MNRVLCLWLPNWPLQRLRAEQPELKSQELVLYRAVRGALQVVACSGRGGVRVGMPLVEAKSLLAAHFAEHDPQADHASLVELAQWCERFSPSVGLAPPDNLALDLTGLEPLLGEETTILAQVTLALRRRGLVCKLAIADTFGAAWALAHFSSELPAIALSGDTPTAIAELPIRALRVAEGDALLLEELGLSQIQDLWTLPRGGVAARLGPELLLRLDQALGHAPEVLETAARPAEVSQTLRFADPVADRGSIDAALQDLVGRICQELHTLLRGVIQLVCELHAEDGKVHQQLLGLYQPTAQPRHLQELLGLQLDRLRLNAPLVAITLTAARTAKLPVWQQELFESSYHADQREVAALIDRLSSRLGRGQVSGALPLAEAQPELAYRYQALAGQPRERARSDAVKRWLRPTHLLAPPSPLEVLAVASRGAPRQFHFQGTQKVAKAWGPERIQTGWWRGQTVQRDYYRVETVTGRRFWLFRRLTDGAWFLHGIFD